jgi:RNA polymerase primary sigma factor
MSSDNKQQLRNLYSEIGFVFGGTTTFENILLLSVEDINSCTIDDVEKILCDQIKDGKFIRLFKQFKRNKGFEETFCFFDNLLNKYNIELDESTIKSLFKFSSSFFDDAEAVDLNNKLINQVLEVYNSSVDDFVDRDDDNSNTSDIVKDYLKQIGKIPLLDESEIKDVFFKVKEYEKSISKLEDEKNNLSLTLGNEDKIAEIDSKINKIEYDIKEAYNYIIEHNLRLVVSIAKKYQNRGLPLIELIQEGNVGLTKNVSKFKVEKGFKFSTYITWWIRQAVTRALNEQSRTISLPVYVVDGIRDINKAKYRLSNELQREPSIKEIAEAVGLTPDKVKEYMKADQEIISLDEPVDSDDPDATRLDFTVKDDFETVEDYVIRKDSGKRMVGMIEELGEYEDKASEKSPTLNQRRRQIMELRYLGDDPLTLQQVGKKFGVSRERIRQIESKSIRIIKVKHKKNEDEINLIPIYDEKDINKKIDNYNIYVQYHNLNIRVLEFHRPSGKFHLRCDNCGRTWSVPIRELGPTSTCIRCDYYKLKKMKEDQEKANEKSTEQVADTTPVKNENKNDFKSRLIGVSKYIGVSIDELHRALYRVDTDDIGFLVKKYDSQMTPDEVIRFNELIRKVRNLVDVDKKSDSARKRKKNNL